MSKLTWGIAGQKLFETGVEQGALYPMSALGTYPVGVAWNGLTGVTESPSGAEATALYADNVKYLNLMSAEEFKATIEAYMYPEEFKKCDGSAEIATGVYVGQQSRQSFGLAYKTLIGNDTEGDAHGYKLHLIYGCTAAPSEKAYTSKNDSPEAITFSWEASTTPVPVTGFKPTSTVVIDSTKTPTAKLTVLEDILYGGASTEARLPLPDEIITLIGTVQG